ncbi:MAG: hypothetical protein IPK80_27650 [Nannocystis sp.]|nr:hypothetical protein [Nannocystis sp.]
MKWHGDGGEVKSDIAALRSGMIRPGLDAAVFVGGKINSSFTAADKPGIIDEFDRFRDACPEKPAYVLGLGGGAARKILDRGDPPGELVDPLVTCELATTTDPDLATALIVADLMDR